MSGKKKTKYVRFPSFSMKNVFFSSRTPFFACLQYRFILDVGQRTSKCRPISFIYRRIYLLVDPSRFLNRIPRLPPLRPVNFSALRRAKDLIKNCSERLAQYILSIIHNPVFTCISKVPNVYLTLSACTTFLLYSYINNNNNNNIVYR